MNDVIRYCNGDINWNENGWPEPNAGSETDDGQFNTDDMPDDIFEIWQSECDDMYDENWSVDG